jgi:hypothetical protein
MLKHIQLTSIKNSRTVCFRIYTSKTNSSFAPQKQCTMVYCRASYNKRFATKLADVVTISSSTTIS